MTFVPTNLANSPSSFFETNLNITTNDNIFSHNSSAPFTAFQINSQTLATFFQVFQQKSNDVLTSLGSWFFTQTKEQNSMPCANNLIVGSALTVLTNNPLPAFVGVFGCLNTITAAKAPFSSLQKFVEAVDDVSSAISGLGDVYSKISITAKIGDGGGHAVYSTDYFEHVVNAILNTASDIQTFASPINSIVTTITDAFAEEALSRFTTLSDLMQLHNEINRIREAIKEGENALKEIHQSNIAEVNDLKKGLRLDFIRTQLNECLTLEKNTRQQIKELENAIVDSETKLTSSSQRFFKLNDSLRTIYESLNKEPELFDEFASKIAQIEEQRDKAESNVYLHQDAIDDFKSRIAENQQNLAEGMLVIQEWQTMLEQRNTFLAQFNSIQTEIASAHQNLLKTEIKKLRDLAETKYAHFRIMLDQANAKLNHKTKKEL